jgi:hypothetical protein
VRYLLHSDFHAPMRLKLNAADAVAYLRERVHGAACAGLGRELTGAQGPARPR